MIYGLGVHIIESKSFKVSLVQCRRSFYRAANAVFGRVGRIDSGEVHGYTFDRNEMFTSFSTRSRSLPLLDFVVKRFFMKLFQTSRSC